MNKRILGGLAVAAMLAGGLAFTSASTATAVSSPPDQVCYDRVRELEYQRTVVVKGDVIQKETQTRTRTYIDAVPAVDGIWQNFSPKTENGPFVGPPSHPTDPGGTWSTVKKLPPGQAGPDGVYSPSGENGNGSWFYRAAGTPGVDGGWSGWSEYGPWTKLPGADQMNDDDRARGPLPLGAGEDWERQYRYVVVGSYVISSAVETSDWRAESAGPPAGTGWFVIDKRFVEGEQIACPQPPPVPPTVTTKYGLCVVGADAVNGEQRTITYKWVLEGFKWVKVVDSVTVNVSRPLTEQEQEACRPDSKVTYGEWNDGEYECGDRTVTITRIVVTTPYVYRDGKWVLDPTGVTEARETDTSELTEQERQDACDKPDDLVKFGEVRFDEIICDSTEFITRQTKSTTPFVWDAEAGEYVEGETVVTENVSKRPLSSDELAAQKAKCTVVTTTTPPAQTRTEVVAAALPPAQAPTTTAPAPTTTAPAPVATTPAAGLPATGSNGTGAAALIALLVTSLGGAALLAARRRNVTT